MLTLHFFIISHLLNSNTEILRTHSKVITETITRIRGGYFLHILKQIPQMYAWCPTSAAGGSGTQVLAVCCPELPRRANTHCSWSSGVVRRVDFDTIQTTQHKIDHRHFTEAWKPYVHLAHYLEDDVCEFSRAAYKMVSTQIFVVSALCRYVTPMTDKYIETLMSITPTCGCALSPLSTVLVF